jgi:hypothetical protein
MNCRVGKSHHIALRHGFPLEVKCRKANFKFLNALAISHAVVR